MSKNGSIIPSSENIHSIVKKLKTLKELQQTLDQNGDIIKMGLLFERLKKLPQYIDWINKIEEKLASQDIAFLSNSQLLKLLELVNKNVNDILKLISDLTNPSQTINDNRKIEINIGTLDSFKELDPRSRDKIRKLFDTILLELDKDDSKD